MDIARRELGLRVDVGDPRREVAPRKGIDVDARRRPQAQPAEVPLGEEQERYEVDIVAGNVVKRTLTVTTAAAIYPVPQQIADFGAAQSAVRVRVYQTSTVWGRGLATEAVL